MIIESIMNVMYSVFETLTSFMSIPDLPTEVYEYVEMAFDYMGSGAGILANYVPLTYLLTLFGIVLAVDIALNIYYLVLWVLKKIPVASIS